MTLLSLDDSEGKDAPSVLIGLFVFQGTFESSEMVEYTLCLACDAIDGCSVTLLKTPFRE